MTPFTNPDVVYNLQFLSLKSIQSFRSAISMKRGTGFSDVSLDSKWKSKPKFCDTTTLFMHTLYTNWFILFSPRSDTHSTRISPFSLCHFRCFQFFHLFGFFCIWFENKKYQREKKMKNKEINHLKNLMKLNVKKQIL